MEIKTLATRIHCRGSGDKNRAADDTTLFCEMDDFRCPRRRCFDNVSPAARRCIAMRQPRRQYRLSPFRTVDYGAIYFSLSDALFSRRPLASTSPPLHVDICRISALISFLVMMTCRISLIASNVTHSSVTYGCWHVAFLSRNATFSEMGKSTLASIIMY